MKEFPPSKTPINYKNNITGYFNNNFTNIKFLLGSSCLWVKLIWNRSTKHEKCFLTYKIRITAKPKMFFGGATSAIGSNFWSVLKKSFFRMPDLRISSRCVSTRTRPAWSMHACASVHNLRHVRLACSASCARVKKPSTSNHTSGGKCL